MSDEYKSNSYKSKAENPEKKVEKIVSGGVKARKKSEAGKLRDMFISDDAVNVKSYVVTDILIPAVKKALYDVVVTSLKMILGDGLDYSSRRSDAERVSYRDYYGKKDGSHRNSRMNTRYSFDDIILEDRGEAEEVLARMEELVDRYGVVSVADFYEMVGFPSNFTDNKYGWMNLRGAEVIRTRDGFMLRLPKALVID